MLLPASASTVMANTVAEVLNGREIYAVAPGMSVGVAKLTPLLSTITLVFEGPAGLVPRFDTAKLIDTRLKPLVSGRVE
jgi:hypothetical protein